MKKLKKSSENEPLFKVVINLFSIKKRSLLNAKLMQIEFFH